MKFKCFGLIFGRMSQVLLFIQLLQYCDKNNFDGILMIGLKYSLFDKASNKKYDTVELQHSFDAKFFHSNS